MAFPGASCADASIAHGPRAWNAPRSAHRLGMAYLLHRLSTAARRIAAPWRFTHERTRWSGRAARRSRRQHGARERGPAVRREPSDRGLLPLQDALGILRTMAGLRVGQEAGLGS